MTMAIQVLLQAITGPYEAAMGRAAGRTVAFEQTVENSSRVGGRFQGAVDGMTGKLVAGGGLLYGLSQTAGALMSYEDALVGVGKTTGLEGQALDDLGERVASLGGQLESSAEEMLRVAQSAAQLGVGRNDIDTFTETIAGLAVATDLTTDQAATDMARLSNILGRPISEVEGLGDVIVNLGNNMATTEPEILNLSTRLAAAGRLAGFADEDVLALSATMSSLGIEAEAGGTAMSKVLRDITEATATGNDKLDIFAETAGMSAQAFADAWQTDPAVALQSFLDGLGGLDQAGQIGTLQDLGLDAERVGDALLRGAGGADMMTDSLGLARDASGALAAEVETATNTASTKLNEVKEEFRELLRDIGGNSEGAEGLARTFGILADTLSVISEFDLQNLIPNGGQVGAGLASRLREELDLDALFSFDPTAIGARIGAAFTDGVAEPANVAAASMEGFRSEADRFRDLGPGYVGAVDDLGSSYDAMAGEIDGASASLDEYILSQQAAVDPMAAFIRAEGQLADARSALADIEADLADGNATLQDRNEAYATLVETSLGYAAAASAAGGASGDATQTIRELGEAGLLTRDQVAEVSAILGETETKAENFVRDYGDATVGVEVDASQLTDLERRLAALDGRLSEAERFRDTSPGGGSPSGGSSGGNSSGGSTPTGAAPIPGAGGLQMRARGGRTVAMSPYVVGEEGPELFVPDQSGYVMDASRSAALMDALGRQQSQQVDQRTFAPTMQFYGQTQPADVAWEQRKFASAAGFA